jgi:hypothetical protein
MSVMVIGVGLIVGLFAAMVALLEVGLRLGIRRPPPVDDAGKSSHAAVEGAVFALMGLLLAFSFSGALSRWDTRRQHIAAEVNAIGTAYLRLDLLPAASQPEIRQRFRDYTDARLAVYEDVLDREATLRDEARAVALQRAIWERALAACRTVDATPPTMLVLPSLNEMFDMAQERDLTAAAHPPLVVFLMLGAAVLTSSLLAGYDMAASKKASRFHMIGYAAMISLTVYVTLDIEFPRIGLVRIDAADAAMVELREGMR